jgi:hypothetical protein
MKNNFEAEEFRDDGNYTDSPVNADKCFICM